MKENEPSLVQTAIPQAVANGDKNMDTGESNKESKPEPDPPFQDGAAKIGAYKIPAGEEPPVERCPPSSLPIPDYVSKSNNGKWTLDAMDAVRQRKIDEPSRSHGLPVANQKSS